MPILRKILFLSLALIFAVAVLPPTAFADIFIYDLGGGTHNAGKDRQDPFQDQFSDELNRFDAIIYRFDDFGKYIGIFGDTPNHLKLTGARDAGWGIGFHPFNNDLYVMEELRGSTGLGSGGGSQSNYMIRIFDGISGKHKKNLVLKDVTLKNTREMFIHPGNGKILVSYEDISNPIDIRRGVYSLMIGEFDPTTGALIREIRDPFGQQILLIGIHPKNGDLFAWQHPGRILRFDGLTGAFKGVVFTDPSISNNAPFINPNGNLVSSLRLNQQEAEARVFDGITGQLIKTFTYNSVSDPNGKIKIRSIFNPATGNFIDMYQDKRAYALQTNPLLTKLTSTAYLARRDPETLAPMGDWGNSEAKFTNHARYMAYQPRLPGPLLMVLPHTWRGAWKYSNTSVAPEKLKFRMFNEGDQMMQYSVASSENWLTINDPGGGQLAPGESVDVEIQFNANADSLGVGKHKSIITFTNDSNDGGTAKRIVRLFVGSSPADISVTTQGGVQCDDVCWRHGSKGSGNQKSEFTLNSGASHRVTLLKTEPWIRGGFGPKEQFKEVGVEGTFDPGEIFETTITANPQIEDFLTLEHNPSGYILVVDKDTNDILAVEKVTLNRNGIFKPVFDKPVTSTFWQADRNTYTFVSVTHPSLSGMAPEIRLKATAFLGNRTGVFGQYSKEFTVSAGKTERLFVISGNNKNSVFYPENSGDKNIIRGIGTGTGFLRFDPVDDPDLNPGSGYPDVTMLSFWGTVVFPDTNTGFAMEFIGDLNDSSVHPGMAAGKFPAGLN